MIVRVSNSVTVDVDVRTSVRFAVASVEKKYTASPSPPDAGAN